MRPTHLTIRTENPKTRVNYLTWVTSSAMLRPSTSVCGFTDTALQTTEEVEKSFELLVGFFLDLRVRDDTEPTKYCLGVRGDKVSSDWVLQRGDVNGFNREAEAIFASSVFVVNSLPLFDGLLQQEKDDENANTSFGLAFWNLCVRGDWVPYGSNCAV